MQDVHNGNYCFAINGESFDLLRIHDPALLDRCIHRAKVFARMSPEGKQHLIECLQKMGCLFGFIVAFKENKSLIILIYSHQVAMVGDGCNDCGALRTADAGISLSMTDASVAAPFTSQRNDVFCYFLFNVLNLIIFH